MRENELPAADRDDDDDGDGIEGPISDKGVVRGKEPLLRMKKRKTDLKIIR